MEPIPSTPEVSHDQTSKRKSIVWPLILMVWLVAGIVIAIGVYAVVNFLVAATGSPLSDDMFESLGIFRTIVNIVLYMVGLASVLLGLPSFVVGLVFLILNASHNSSVKPRT